jgi:hypothetical protein
MMKLGEANVQTETHLKSRALYAGTLPSVVRKVWLESRNGVNK